MDFVDAIKVCLNKYADFKGRATRPEFWWFMLFQVIVLIVAGMLGKFVYFVAVAALLLPAVAVGARRLHDIGKSGWFQLVYLIPVIGFFLAAVLVRGKPSRRSQRPRQSRRDARIRRR